MLQLIFFKLWRVSSTEPLKVFYLRSNICLWSQCTCTCLRIFVLARTRREQGLAGIPWDSTAQGVHRWLSPTHCFLPPTSAYENYLLLPKRLRCSCQEVLCQNLIFNVKLDFNLPRSHFFPFVPNFCYFGTEKFSGLEKKKSFFWWVEVTILVVLIK